MQQEKISKDDYIKICPWENQTAWNKQKFNYRKDLIKSQKDLLNYFPNLILSQRDENVVFVLLSKMIHVGRQFYLGIELNEQKGKILMGIHSKDKEDDFYAKVIQKDLIDFFKD